MAFETVGVRIVIVGMSKFRRSALAFGKIAAGMAAAVAGVGIAAGILAFTAVKTAISVESAFAGVAKTTDGLVDSMGDLTEEGEKVKQQFRDLARDVPIAIEELLGIGELAGQLGIPREALAEFSRTVAELSVTTNLTQEEAATDLARLATIFQVSMQDMAANTERVGATLVDLGNNFATTERDILSFGKRIAGAGVIVGLTQAEVLAIGTALSSVGVEAQVGGTAVQKVLIAMQKAIVTSSDELEVFASTAGISVDEFVKAFEVDAAGAFQGFVEGLGKQGDEAILTLSELGLQDQRLIRAFLSLASAGDLLGRTMTIANNAFDENTALSEEAQKRFQTTESQLKILKNTFRDLAITIGDALLPFLNQAVSALKPFIERLGKELPGVIERVIDFFSNKLPEAFGEVMFFLQPIIDGIRNLFGAFVESAPIAEENIADFLAFLKESIFPTVLIIVKNVGEALDRLAEFWREHGETVIRVVRFAFETITATIAGFMALVTGIVNTILAIIQGDWDAALETILGTLGGFFSAALGVVDTKLKEFLGSWKRVFDSLKVLITIGLDRAKQAILDLVQGFVAVGRAIIDGIISGIKQRVQVLIDTVKNLAKSALDAIRNLLDIGSPSGVFETIGAQMMQGLAKGIAASVDLPELVGRVAVDRVAAPALAAAGGTTNSTTLNFDATFRQPDSPISVRDDLLAILAMTQRT